MTKYARLAGVSGFDVGYSWKEDYLLLSFPVAMLDSRQFRTCTSCCLVEFEPLSDDARLELVKDYQGLLLAKRQINNSYDYTGTEKLAKCQELSEVSRCAVAGARRRQNFSSVKSPL